MSVAKPLCRNNVRIESLGLKVSDNIIRPPRGQIDVVPDPQRAAKRDQPTGCRYSHKRRLWRGANLAVWHVLIQRLLAVGLSW